MVRAAGMMAMERVIRRRSHGRMRKLRIAFHDHLAGQGAGEGGGLAGAEQGDGEDDAGEAGAQQRRQQHVRLLNLGDHDVRA